MEDIVALCKAQPGQISFGSAGAGSAQHLALEMFKLQAKVDALHVPYKGSGPLLTDLMGGQIQYSFETMTAATPHVKSGKVIAIAQTRTKRAKGHPNVPTMQEQGFEGFEATTWYGLVGPGKLPPAIAQKINADVNTVLAMPDVQEQPRHLRRRGRRRLGREVRAVHPHRDRQVGEGGEGRRRQGRQLTDRAAAPKSARWPPAQS